MHVMHIVDSLHGGGAETSLLEVVPGLASRGVKTSVVTLFDDDGALESRVNALGIARVRLQRSDPFRLALELRNVIRSHRPDILHTTLLFANLVGRMAARGFAIPVVTTLPNEDYGPEHRANSRYGAAGVLAAQATDLLTVRLTTRFHAISEEVARVMSRRLMIPKARVQVIYRGRDPAKLGVPSLARRLQVRASLQIDAKTPLVLSVGRLDRQKSVETTIDAFRRLATRMPDALLLVAGRPGNAYGVVQASADGNPAVRLLGHRTDVPDLMCAADVLSFPSRWEGLGGTLIEAMALRLPIVASDIPPIAETIGDVGWPLVSREDARALSDALVSVLEAETVNESKKDAGQRRFNALFTADAAAGGMAGLYQRVLCDSGRRA
jgi:glycosyltransferase involved in cell wall biosynthesis